MQVIISVVILLAMIAALFDVISRDDSQIRGLPKLVWIILIVIIPFAGSILWFLLGREPKAASYRPTMSRHPAAQPQASPPLFEHARTPTLSTEEQLAALDREIFEQEELDRIRQLEAEIEQRRKDQAD